MRALAALALAALAACAAPEPAPTVGGPSRPEPTAAETAVEDAIARREAEIAALRPATAEDPRAARRVRQLEREVEQIKQNAASGEAGRPAPQLLLRF